MNSPNCWATLYQTRNLKMLLNIHYNTELKCNISKNKTGKACQWLCGMPSVLAGTRLLISPIQPSPLASKAACTITKRRTVCVSLSLPVHSLSTATPMQCLLTPADVTWDCKAHTLNLRGQNCMTQQWNWQMRKIKVSRAVTVNEVILKIVQTQSNVHIQTSPSKRVLVNEAARQISLWVCNINRR